MIRFLIVVIFSYSFLAHSFDWQGHRGARGLYPENTIGAMEEALKYPVTTLEMDLVISKDSEVVVSHEPWISPDYCRGPKDEKVANRAVNLYKLNYSEIVTYDCGSTAYPRFPKQKKIKVGKPLLSALLRETESMLKKLNRTDVGYNIEIKSTVEDERDGFQPAYEKFSDLVVKTVREHLKENRFTIQSFDFRVLRYIHKKYPEIQLSCLVETEINPQEIVKKLGFIPQVFSPDFTKLKALHVKFFHDQKVKVIPWTVNDVASMKRLISMDVDGIITDYPNLISEALAKDCPAKHNLFEGQCVKMPAHSVPYSSNPGWKCKDGYVQKRNRCVEIKLPAHAEFQSDGKTWICKNGFERYRGKCRKIKE